MMLNLAMVGVSTAAGRTGALIPSKAPALTPVDAPFYIDAASNSEATAREPRESSYAWVDTHEPPPVRDAHWLQGLSPAQHAAVVDPSPRLLVLAGAGSGKTRVLVSKVVQLLAHERFDPASLHVFSFTRKACEEIVQRLHTMLPEEHTSVRRCGLHSMPHSSMPHSSMLSHSLPQLVESSPTSNLPSARRLGSPRQAHLPTVDTVHRYAWRLISQHHQAIGILQPPTLLGPDDHEAVLACFELFLKEVSPRVPEGSPAQLLERMRPTAGALMDPRLSHLEQLFRGWKCLHGQLELVDLVPLAYQLLQTPVGELERRRLRAVLIDEFQDIDPDQWKVLERLIGEHTRLILFGDDDQAIYRWRGSEPELIRHQHRRSDVKVHLLTTNYRCQKPILTLANHVIAQDAGRVHRDAVAHRQGGPVPTCITSPSPGQAVVRVVEMLLSRGRGVLDLVILVRNHRCGGVIRKALLKTGIPCSLTLEGFGVRILTYHASKGLEFPVVLLPFMQQDIFPAAERLVERETWLKNRLKATQAASRRQKWRKGRLMGLRARLLTSVEKRLTPVVEPSQRPFWQGGFRHWFGGEWLRAQLELKREWEARRQKRDAELLVWETPVQQALDGWPEERQAILSEERRLCYVAMTRARDELWLFCSDMRQASEFIRAIPGSMLQVRPLALLEAGDG